MSAPEAADVAGITYRQLDYWGRKGWVVPAHVEHVSAGRRVRRYDLQDVLRLAALAHLGRSGLDVAAYGPTVGSLELATSARQRSSTGSHWRRSTAGHLIPTGCSASTSRCW